MGQEFYSPNRGIASPSNRCEERAAVHKSLKPATADPPDCVYRGVQEERTGVHVKTKEGAYHRHLPLFW